MAEADEQVADICGTRVVGRSGQTKILRTGLYIDSDGDLLIVVGGKFVRICTSPNNASINLFEFSPRTHGPFRRCTKLVYE